MRLLSAALAAPPLLALDGSAHLLAADGERACWWIVDDAGDARRAGCWDGASETIRLLAALPGDRVLVARREARGEGWRIGVRGEDGERALARRLPGPPERVWVEDAAAGGALAWTRAHHDDLWCFSADERLTSFVLPPGATRDPGFRPEWACAGQRAERP